MMMSEEEIGRILATAVYDPDFVTPEMVHGYYTPFTIKDWEVALLGIVRDAGKNELPEPLDAIKATTLLIWGEDDTWVAPGHGEVLRAGLPNAELVIIPEAGHLPMEERPDDFNALLLSYLESG
jgi:pimeloyl-ACP methyl ester carboxylesterase